MHREDPSPPQSYQMETRRSLCWRKILTVRSSRLARPELQAHKPHDATRSNNSLRSSAQHRWQSIQLPHGLGAATRVISAPASSASGPDPCKSCALWRCFGPAANWSRHIEILRLPTPSGLECHSTTGTKRKGWCRSVSKLRHACYLRRLNTSLETTSKAIIATHAPEPPEEVTPHAC